MRSPERVLNSLNEHSKDSSYKFERLYRLLFNEELFYVAYQKIASNEGSTTKGSDGRSIDGMSLARIETLIASLKDESYQPTRRGGCISRRKTGRCALWEYRLLKTSWCRR